MRSKEGQPLDGLNVKLDSSANNGSTTDDSGRYVLRVPGGPVSLSVLQHGKIQKRVKLKVPSDSYDIVLDEVKELDTSFERSSENSSTDS